MNQAINDVRGRMLLLATNPMRIAGLQGVYGDPCGIELIPITVTEALCRNREPIVLIDAGSVSPLFEVLKRLRYDCPRTHLIVIGTDADDTYIECVIGAGAKGFLSATASLEEFRIAIENVRDGSVWAPHKVLSRLVGRENRDLTQRRKDYQTQLTPRETEVLQLLLGGKSNQEIGTKLEIDAGTVKGHLGRMMRKAGVLNRVQLSMYALDHRENHL